MRSSRGATHPFALRSLTIALLAIFALCLGVAATHGGELYRWKDENGEMHVSTTPPPDDAEVIAEKETDSAEGSSSVSRSGGQVVSSQNSTIFHVMACHFAERISEENRISYESPAAAKDAGLEPHSCVSKSPMRSSGSGSSSSSSSSSSSYDLDYEEPESKHSESYWRGRARSIRKKIRRDELRVERYERELSQLRLRAAEREDQQRVQERLEKAREDVRVHEEEMRRLRERGRKDGALPAWFR